MIIKTEEFDIPDEFKELDVPDKFKGIGIPQIILCEDYVPDEKAELRNKLIKYLKSKKIIKNKQQIICLTSCKTGNILIKER